MTEFSTILNNSSKNPSLFVIKGDLFATKGDPSATKGSSSITKRDHFATKGSPSITKGDHSVTKGSSSITTGDPFTAKAYPLITINKNVIMKTFLLICIVTLSTVEASLCFSQENFSCKHFKQTSLQKDILPSPEGEGLGDEVALADSLRSDTINILKYTINLQITDFTAPDTIKGNTQVLFAPKINNVNTLSLDLLRMTIDSVEINNSNLSYSYNDTLLIINLPLAHNIGDTSVVTVYYRGDPVMDASGWGGWYNQSGYAFNLGVGFAADPHNYGRVWFPCFDNFVERSKYEFNIKTNGGKIAYCNGALTKDTTDANGFRTRTWVMNEEIPTYLASVAVAAYTQVNKTFTGINGNVPVVLAAVPADTTNVKNSFINLQGAFNAYENRYGPYMWNKVGYSMVPFGSGAMEHASNIAYPRALANGSLTYENIMAHEFSHHWWGDLVTCSDHGDMWINEGMATYSEHLFTEWIYGTTAYKNLVRANHEDAVHYLHIRNGGYLPLSPVSHANTYDSYLVYNKGADVAHTMRGYLGDSLFFLGLKYVLANNQFTDISSADFRDEMTAATGVNMNDYFSGWIFGEGWPQFSIDSFTSVPNGGNYDVTVYIKQRLDNAPNLFNSVPLEITFKDASWNSGVKTIIASGLTSSATVTIPVNPIFAGVDLNEKINEAITADQRVIKTAGTFFTTNVNSRMQVVVQNITSGDSAFLFVEHNWVAPDSFKVPNSNYLLAKQRYWKVSGIFPQLFDATATITYDGRTIMSGGGGHLDNQLITATNQEDSVALLYRPNASYDWSWFPYYTKTISNPADKYGVVKIDSLFLGEYTFALLKNGVLGVSENENESGISIYPNPTSGVFVIASEAPPAGRAGKQSQIEVYNMYGEMVLDVSINQYTNLPAGEVSQPINLSSQPSGIYFVKEKTSKGVAVKKIVLQK